MDYAFAHSTHDRAAHLRLDDAWRSSDVRVMVVGGEHVATNGGRGIRWISLREAPEGEWIFLGLMNGQAYAAVIVGRVPSELDPQSLRVIGPTIAAEDASMAVHAVGIARWHQANRFCSRCGTPTEIAQAGHVRHCASCHVDHFPRTDPAVIMLITDHEDRALLGRQSSWPEGRFSTLAGFVEPGESLDDAVRREVLEEVGVSVETVTFAGSQPWPFPSSLMLGYFGRATTNEITVDEDEIAEARWFERDELAALSASGKILLPPPVSISRWLVDTWHGAPLANTW